MPTFAELSALDFLRVTQSAAIGAYHWLGRGNKEAGDDSAVSAMRKAFDSIPAQGIVVVGEGEKDDAPMLYVGEHVGTGEQCLYDIVVDPLEGTRLLATGKPNAIAVLGVAPHGTIHAPKESFYMEKIVVAENVAKSIDIEAPIEILLQQTAKTLGKDITELTVFVLEKPRHKNLIDSILHTGARIQLHTDGDVTGSLLAISPHSSIDIMLGVGGTPEGVLTATAIRANGGGQIFARFAPQSEEERNALVHAGVDISKRFCAEDMVTSSSVFFVATGVTDGQLLSGISQEGDSFKTHSLLMQGLGKRSFFIEEHVND